MRVTANRSCAARIGALPFIGYAAYGDARLRLWGVPTGPSWG
jgi:hypothetical protein